MEKSKKKALVAKLQAIFANSNLVVISSQQGMNVNEDSDLRAKARATGGGYMVTKNSLAKLAAKGTAFEALTDHFTGPTAIFYSEDPVAAAKVAVDYAKENSKLKVVCGASDGRLFELHDVEVLASLPSLDELRGKLVGLLQAPAGKIASVVQAPAGQLARVFSAYGSSE
ncbi:MAG: 50S ribosomal protein L10 [Alphaproteobacteria bacterium]